MKSSNDRNRKRSEGWQQQSVKKKHTVPNCPTLGWGRKTALLPVPPGSVTLQQPEEMGGGAEQGQQTALWVTGCGNGQPPSMELEPPRVLLEDAELLSSTAL